MSNEKCSKIKDFLKFGEKVKAMRFDGTRGSASEIVAWAGESAYWEHADGALKIRTPFGLLTARAGDWVTLNTAGEWHPTDPVLLSDIPVSEQSAHNPSREVAGFSSALEWLKEGKRVRRAGWNGAGQWVVLIDPGNAMYTKGGASALMKPCLGLKNAQGEMQPGWVPSMGDLLATDWLVFIEQPVSDIPPHQMRVLQELSEVSLRHEKLIAFTGTELFASLGEEERDRLIRQVNAMGDYCAVLIERIAAF